MISDVTGAFYTAQKPFLLFYGFHFFSDYIFGAWSKSLFVNIYELFTKGSIFIKNFNHTTLWTKGNQFVVSKTNWG